MEDREAAQVRLVHQARQDHQDHRDRRVQAAVRAAPLHRLAALAVPHHPLEGALLQEAERDQLMAMAPTMEVEQQYPIGLEDAPLAV